MLNLQGLQRVRMKPTDEYRWASVALIVDAETDELLLIKRAENANDPWSGNVAAPGGVYEERDGDLFETAVRETKEEIGVDLGFNEFVGILTPSHPSNTSIIRVLPHVFEVKGKVPTQINRAEVEYVFWLPLRMTPLMVRPYSYGSLYKSWAIYYQNNVIWGMTYRIIKELLMKANIAELPDS
jgi:8-oxo-dGTP pyrophosphatase MutT (NUDIX family)